MFTKEIVLKIYSKTLWYIDTHNSKFSRETLKDSH